MGRLPSPLQGHLAWLLSLACHLAGVGLLYLLASYSEPVLPARRAPGPVLKATLLSDFSGQRAQPSFHQPQTTAPASVPTPPVPDQGAAAKSQPAAQTSAPAKPHGPANASPPTSRPRVSPPPLPARESQPAPAAVKRPSPTRPPQRDPPQPPLAEPKPESIPIPAAVPNAKAIAQPASAHPVAATPVSGATTTLSPAGSASDEPPLITHARYRGKPRPVEYPPQARQRGWQGTVVVEVWLDGEGKQLRREIIQSSGRSLLDRAALRSVARSDFYPLLENGRGRPSRLRLPVIFKLTSP